MSCDEFLPIKREGVTVAKRGLPSEARIVLIFWFASIVFM